MDTMTGVWDSAAAWESGVVENSNVVDGEIIAPGFRLYSSGSEMGAISDSWVITGALPKGSWRKFNHYDLQGKLIAEGLLRPEHCDSELGMFCVYPPDEATARLVGAWLNERL